MLCRKRCVTCCRSVCVCSKRRRARTGPTGPTGPTGVTGVTAATVTANNAYITSVGIKQVVANGTIPLDSNVILNGTAISHTIGSSDVTLAANQTYQVNYQTEAISPADGALVSARLNLGGAAVNSTTDSRANTTAGDIIPLSGSALVTTTSATTLNIQNASISNGVAAAVSFQNTAFSIVKVK